MKVLQQIFSCENIKLLNTSEQQRINISILEYTLETIFKLKQRLKFNQQRKRKQCSETIFLHRLRVIYIIIWHHINMHDIIESIEVNLTLEVIVQQSEHNTQSYTTIQTINCQSIEQKFEARVEHNESLEVYYTSTHVEQQIIAIDNINSFISKYSIKQQINIFVICVQHIENLTMWFEWLTFWTNNSIQMREVEHSQNEATFHDKKKHTFKCAFFLWNESDFL